MLLADAIEHCDVSEAPGEIRFTGPKEFTLSFRDAGMKAAVLAVIGRPLKVTFIASETAAATAPKPQANADEATQRALSHPDVQRFQQAFPGSHVRTVRNLRD